MFKFRRPLHFSLAPCRMLMLLQRRRLLTLSSIRRHANKCNSFTAPSRRSHEQMALRPVMLYFCFRLMSLPPCRRCAYRAIDASAI